MSPNRGPTVAKRFRSVIFSANTACDTSAVPDASDPDPLIEEMQARLHQSRWYPVAGGHRVLMLHDGGEFDAKRFQVEAGAWDHEHCNVCEKQIAAMTLCYVTKEGWTYVLLCKSC